MSELKLLPAISSGTPLLDRVHHCDALVLLKALPSNCIDLVVTSPPYNLQNTTGGGIKGAGDKGLWSQSPLANGYENYDDNMPHDEYVTWQRNILVESMRIIKPTGAIFYNHKWRVQGGLLQDRADIVNGFPVRQIIIWERGGGINFSDRFFLPNYEVIYLIAKPDYKLSPKASSFKDVWHFPPENNNAHPAPFPLALPYRCIYASALPEKALIVDPFLGSGTTALAAQKLGHHWIGCDTSVVYVEMARRKLGLDVTLDDLPMFAALVS